METRPLLREFGSELTTCSTRWGQDVHLSSPIASHTGSEGMFETAVPGVIGMHGNEPGAGPSVVIKDIENSGIEMLWTKGLVGCMCIAIIGKDEGGKLDAFFCHARKYDLKGAVNDPDNPMFLARQFIEKHNDIRVFWGTDFSYGLRDSSGPAKRHAAQVILSNELGFWVRESDCVVFRELVFLPRLGILRDGNPKEVYEWAKRQEMTGNLQVMKEFSLSKGLGKFTPDPLILKKLEDHLTVIKNDRESYIRFYFHDSRRTNKILVLAQIVDAYKAGNLDILRIFAKSAQEKSSPFRDASAVNVWSAAGESATAKLVIEAYNDAVSKIAAMGANRCGLRENGDDIFNYQEYQEALTGPRETAKK